ncbi:MAG: PorV/PorQ family protein [Calditrichaeota bacterium]|nr:PorV/PorQ family protein [Calditrichota bacterium]
MSFRSDGRNKHSARFFNYCSGIVCAVLLLIAQTIHGQDFGRLGASLLRISPNARQVGMGEAFTAMANQHNALRYNVGGLGLLQHIAFSVNFHNWIDDTNQGNIEVSWPFSRGVLGFGLTYFDQGEIQALDENFQPTVNSSGGSSDLMLTAVYGTYINIGNHQVSFGGGPKLIRQDLADFTSTSFGFDIGAAYVMRNLSFGATWQNLTLKKAKFDTQSDLLPQILRFGVAGNLTLGENLNLNLASDVAKLRSDDKLRIYTGSELHISELLAVRAGYKIHDTEASRWAVGLGVTMPTQWLGNSRTNIDYAFSPLDDFDESIHRFSFTFTFGVIRPSEPEAIPRPDIAGMQKQLEDELKAAEEARRRAEEAARLAELSAKELERRLAIADSIARASEGKIEVTPAPDTSRIQVSLRINFDFDKSDIRPSEFKTMEQIAQILNTFPEYKLWISGHTDSIGTQVYNMHLSNRRMQSVMTYLTTKGRIVSSERFFMSVAYGETRPVADNGTEEGRFLNRRVDFTIFTRDSIPEIPEGTAITSVHALNENSFAIVANGRVKFRQSELAAPPRLVFDFPGIFNLSLAETYNFVGEVVQRARIGFHPQERFTRVVFDLKRNTRYDAEMRDNMVVVRIYP